MTAPVLALRGLDVTIPVAQGALHAVRGIDLSLQRGETLCLVGESGCGKSMTALAVMGLQPARARRELDSLTVLGEDASAPRHIETLRGDRIAMIFQEPMTALNPSYTVGEQLVEHLLHHRPGYGRVRARARAIELLETCGIGQAASRLRQYPHQLSGGLRQRVMIAMALMTEPAVLIADEPTTALDVTIQAQILDLLADLQRRFDLAILLITHDLGVVRRFGHRVAVMYAGELVETGRVADVLAKPLHPYTRALLACVPELDAIGAPTHRLGHLAGSVPSLLGAPQGCQFRNRCAQARDACASTVPWRALEAERGYRCVLAQDAEHMQRAAPTALPPRIAIDPQDFAVEAQGITRSYRMPGGFFGPRRELAALRGVDLSLRVGESLGIVGESGSGKSTLARILLGLETATAGRVKLFGQPVGEIDRRALARLVQPVFQDPYGSLNPRRPVGDTIRLPLDIHAIDAPAARQAAVRRMMDLCGLQPRLVDAYPNQLSGGQRQRVAIASALILSPRIVICDEPTSALDVSVQAQIINLLRDLRSELGLTLIVISHDLGVIRHLADRVAVMYLGTLIELGDAQRLFADPRHPYTRSLLAAAGAAGGRAVAPGEFPDPMSPPPGCSFHPRCAIAVDRCRREAPRPVGPTHPAACHLAPLE